MRSTLKPLLFLVIIWFAGVVFFLGVGPLGNKPFLGFPLDDTWIHFSFARNLAEHHGFGLNPCEPSSGSTSPLWVVLLAFLNLLGLSFETAALGMGIFFVLLTALCVEKIVFALTGEKKAAVAAALLVLLSGRFLWGALSGMEVALFSFLAACGICLHQKFLQGDRGSLLPALVFGLASLARPEGHLLFVLACGDLCLRNIRRLKEVGPSVFSYVVVYLAVVSSYLGFSWILTHRFFCSSYYSKMLFTWRMEAWPYLKEYVSLVFLDNPFLAVFLFSGLWEGIRRRWGLLSIWLVVFPLAASRVSPILIHHGRYLMPLIPFYVIAGFLGLHRLLHGRAYRIVLVMAIVWSIAGVGLWGRTYATDSLSIYGQHYRAALWLRDHTDPQDAVASNDIGVISYVSGRYVVDLCGIIRLSVMRIMCSSAPEESRRHMLWRYLAARRVKYLAYYPEWFPWVDDRACLKKVYEVRFTGNTIAASDTMEVYRVLCIE
ncbi:MAG: hypothetical protein PHH75_01370 [Candidatus Omnitrophica bacterium]|nr:hypothetical protein [Candidatus Omnitrophota bacterium]MDD5573808.1 hypothetical protein [Candidatus Omnitrophota bacterium]